jgi:putative ABC transport system ATP-binding protein
MAVLNTKSLSKVYGKGDHEFKALDNINISIEQGESIAIVGKSGSGKSTLMHLMALLDKPTSGKIKVNGKVSEFMNNKELNHLRNNNFGFVFQQFFLNANDTVLSNVILPLKIAGVRSKDRQDRAMKVLVDLGIADKAKNKAADLSGGQKQRVVIARALINTPKIIFADEPTGNLDSNTGKLIEDILFNLNKEQKITLVIVTHDADLAKRCSRRVFMKDGKVVGSIE